MNITFLPTEIVAQILGLLELSDLDILWRTGSFSLRYKMNNGGAQLITMKLDGKSAFEWHEDKSNAKNGYFRMPSFLEGLRGVKMVKLTRLIYFKGLLISFAWIHSFGSKLMTLDLQAQNCISILIKPEFWPNTPSKRFNYESITNLLDGFIRNIQLSESLSSPANVSQVDPWIPVSVIFPNLTHLRLASYGHTRLELSDTVQYLEKLHRHLPASLLHFETDIHSFSSSSLVKSLPSNLETLTYPIENDTIFPQTSTSLSGIWDARIASLLPRSLTKLLLFNKIPTLEAISALPRTLTELQLNFLDEDFQTLAALPTPSLTSLRLVGPKWYTTSSIAGFQYLPPSLISFEYTIDFTVGDSLRHLPASIRSLLLPSARIVSTNQLSSLPPALQRLSIYECKLSLPELLDHLPRSMQNLKISPSQLPIRDPHFCLPTLPHGMHTLYFVTPKDARISLDPFNAFKTLRHVTLKGAAIDESLLAVLPPSLQYLSLRKVYCCGLIASTDPQLLEETPSNSILTTDFLRHQLFKWTVLQLTKCGRSIKFDVVSLSNLMHCPPYVSIIHPEFNFDKMSVRQLPPSLKYFYRPITISWEDISFVPPALEDSDNLTVQIPSNIGLKLIQENSSLIASRNIFTCPHSLKELLQPYFKVSTQRLKCEFHMTDSALSALPPSLQSLSLPEFTHISSEGVRLASLSNLTRLSIPSPSSRDAFLPNLQLLPNLRALSTSPCFLLGLTCGFHLIPLTVTKLDIYTDMESPKKALTHHAITALPNSLIELRITHPCNLTNAHVTLLPPALVRLSINTILLTDECEPLLPASLKSLCLPTDFALGAIQKRLKRKT
jgi:hypothetical protein